MNPFADTEPGSKSTKSTNAYDHGGNPFADSLHDSKHSSSAYHDRDTPTKSSGGRDLSTWENQLRQREHDLEEREMRVAQREKQLGGSGAVHKPNNWPFGCYAITYHSIEDEIPAPHRRMCGSFYYLCMATWLCLILNWLTIMIVWSNDSLSNGGQEAMWASIFVVLGVPGSWNFWYRALYSGLINEKSSYWVVFFINFFLHVCFCVVMFIAPPKCAGGGLLYTFKMFGDGHGTAGFFSLITAVLWAANLGMSGWLARSAWVTWRSIGAPKSAANKAAAKPAAGNGSLSEPLDPESSSDSAV